MAAENNHKLRPVLQMTTHLHTDVHIYIMPVALYTNVHSLAKYWNRIQTFDNLHESTDVVLQRGLHEK